jgi:hypothetical protein
MKNHFSRFVWIALALGWNAWSPTHAADSGLTPVVLGPRESEAHSTDHAVPRIETTSEFAALLDHPEQWAQLRPQVGALLYTDHALKNVPDAQLAQWMTEMRALHLTLELEVGALKPWSYSGAGSFKKDSATWDRIIKAGGVISAVSMDEPLPAASRKTDPPMTTDEALDQIAIFVQLVHQHYPQTKVGLINAYPHFTPDQARQAIDGLQARLKQKGDHGLDFYRMDPNWIAFVLKSEEGSWDGMKQIQDYCDSIGLPFSLIYWPAGYPRDVINNHGVQDDNFWYQGLMQEAAGYAGTGAHPDQIVVESWVGAPSRTLPDTDKLTLTGSSLEVLQKVGSPPAH